jgi:hypothetical protein
MLYASVPGVPSSQSQQESFSYCSKTLVYIMCMHGSALFALHFSHSFFFSSVVDLLAWVSVMGIIYWCRGAVAASGRNIDL